MKTRIKICGITGVDDARVAQKLGVDYLGLIFAESPRQIDVVGAREIKAATSLQIVGVFRDAAVDEVAKIVTDVHIDLIQLHGDESPEYCAELRACTGRPIIKAFCSSAIPDTELLGAYETTSFFLFDLDKDMLEDEGLADTMSAMWGDVSRARRKGFRLFVAGALNEGNVREAIRRTNAYCVDVCRGVEKSPGVKDEKAMKRFIEEVRA